MVFAACNVAYITEYYHRADQFLLYFNTDIKSENTYYELYLLWPVNASMMSLGCFAHTQ